MCCVFYDSRMDEDSDSASDHGDNEDCVICFADGSADNMIQKVGGIGVYFPDHTDYNISTTISKKGMKVTNQKMELTACIKAIEQVKKNSLGNKIIIYTDSMYTINCATKWGKNWKKHGWTNGKKEIINLPLIKKLYGLVSKIDVTFIHVNSHRTEPEDEESEEWKRWYGNKNADSLAVSASHRK